jgi:hypothetical protein
MKRALAIAVLAAGAVVIANAIARRPASATIDDDVFTSREADVRMLAPRGWRVTDSPSYPGVLLWLNRSKPPGQMLLTVEDISPPSRACWPKECGHEATVADFVCVLSSRLRGAGFTVGPVEDGRWFDYQEGKNARRFLRQGVVVLGHHAFTLILAAPTSNDRAAQARGFDRSLRSLRPLSSAGGGAETSGEGQPTGGAPIAVADDGGVVILDGGRVAAAAPAAYDARPGDDAPRAGDAETAILDDGGTTIPALTPPDAPPPPTDAGVQVIENVPPCRAP